MISTVVGARIQIRSIFTLANNTTRVSNLCGRKEHVYGNEEGHDVKNEFRKDKWIKKHRRTTAVRSRFLFLTASFAERS